MKSKNAGIQWMRAIAALLVVVDHCIYTLIDKANGDASMAPLATLLGGTGVKLFFVISGLVMLVSSTKHFGVAASRDFMVRRLTRIIPLYWIMTAIYGAKLWLTGEPVGLIAWVKSLLFIPYLNAHGEFQPIYGLGWTLNHEIFFYVLFALGLMGSFRATLLISFTALVGIVGAGNGLELAKDAHAAPLFSFYSRPIALFFLVGMGVALAMRQRAIKSWLSFDFNVAATGAVILVAGALAADHLLNLPMWTQVFFMGLPVLLASAAEVKDGDRVWPKMAMQVGDASYSIYLTHSFVIGPLARVFAKIGLSNPVGYIGVSLCLCTFLGILVYKHIELPAVRFLAARLKRPTGAVGALGA